MKVVSSEIVAVLPLPAVLIRRDERIEAINEAGAALLGQGLQGRHFITALRQPTLLDAIEDCLRNAKNSDPKFITSEDGQDMTYRVAVRHLALESGTGVLVSFQDVTHESQIGQMRRDFVANVSHELRTPLTSIIGFIETLQGPAANDPVGRGRFLNIMADEASRMNRLVGDLLSLSKVEADERVRPTDEVELCDLVRATLKGLERLATQADVHLSYQLPEEGVTVLGDADQLRQVLTNLTENAIKYSGAGCNVTVTLTRPEYHSKLRSDGVVLSVIDTGEGLDAIHIPRLTERFYRVDSHRSREMGGTGLGLAIVKHIVNRHRGRLRISSEKGKGTQFMVILPEGV